MKPGSARSTYQLLNSEDKRFYVKCKAQVRNKFAPLLFFMLAINFFVTFTLFAITESRTSNPIVLMIVFVSPSFLLGWIGPSITFPRYWSLFCEEKSIFVENRTSRGYKVAIEQYIAGKKDYYTKSTNPPIWDSWRNQYEEEYKCKFCSEKISLKGKLCSNCGENTPICVICFGDPEPNEGIAVVMCCGSYVHKNHIDTWMASNNTCPHCQQESPDIRRVKSDFKWP